MSFKEADRVNRAAVERLQRACEDEDVDRLSLGCQHLPEQSEFFWRGCAGLSDQGHVKSCVHFDDGETLDSGGCREISQAHLLSRMSAGDVERL